MKNLFMILIVLFFGCAADSGGGGGSNGESNTLINPTGKAEAGMCYLLSAVSATSTDASWNQTGYTPGEMKKNDGSYVIMGTVSGPYVSYYFNGTCFNEPDNKDVDNVVMKMVQPIGAAEHNINHATTLWTFVAEDHFNDPNSTGYQSIPESFTLAKTEIYDFFGFPNATKNFYEMSITGDTVADAYLLLFESAISLGRSGPQQNDYVGRLGNAILSGDLSVRAELRNDIQNLKIGEIVKNLNAKLESLGFTDTAAPIWNVVDDEYYADILDGSTDVQGAYNMDTSGTCSIDVSDRNLFAVPYIFESWIETSDYLALNVQGNPTVSIWSHHVDEYDRPYQKLVDIETMKEVLLEDPVKLSYNGVIGSAISSGTNIYLVFEYPENVAFSKGCTGEMVKFGRILASNDGGLNWIGWDNVTPWFNRFGLKVVGVSK